MPGVRVLGVAVAVAVLTLATGCGAGRPEYQPGDCLKTSVDQDGAAVKTECSDPKSFKVTMLARNGGRPTCPFYMSQGEAGDGAAYVTDALTMTTYCGPYNGPY